MPHPRSDAAITLSHSPLTRHALPVPAAAALFVPRLKEVLMRLLPLLSSVRNSALRVAVGKGAQSEQHCQAAAAAAVQARGRAELTLPPSSPVTQR